MAQIDKLKLITLPLDKPVIGIDGKLTKDWYLALMDAQEMINQLIKIQKGI